MLSSAEIFTQQTKYFERITNLKSIALDKRYLGKYIFFFISLWKHTLWYSLKISTEYGIYPQYWDNISTYHTSPKIWNNPFYYLLMCLKYCSMANSVDPDRCHILWHLVWVYNVCKGVSVPVSNLGLFLYPQHNYFFMIFIVFGFNDTSTHVGHFVLSPREREKRDRKDSRGDKKRRTGEKGNTRNKNIPLATLTCCKDSRPCPTVS